MGRDHISQSITSILSDQHDYFATCSGYSLYFTNINDKLSKLELEIHCKSKILISFTWNHIEYNATLVHYKLLCGILA